MLCACSHWRTSQVSLDGGRNWLIRAAGRLPLTRWTEPQLLGAERDLNRLHRVSALASLYLQTVTHQRDIAQLEALLFLDWLN